MVQQRRSLQVEQNWIWCCKSDITNEIANLELNRKKGTTQMVLQSENEMGNWSDKSAITNGVANLKLHKNEVEQAIQIRWTKWCCNQRGILQLAL
jgi:hypothetical protein